MSNLQVYFIWALPGGPADMMTGSDNAASCLRHPDNAEHVLVATIAVPSWDAAMHVYRAIQEFDPILLHSKGEDV